MAEAGTAIPTSAPSDGDRFEGRFRRDAATWLCYAGVAGVLGFEIGLGSAMPVLRDSLGIGLTIASLHFTALAAAGTLSAAISNRLAGAWGRATLFRLSLGACVLGCAGTAAGASALWSILAVTLFGFGGALVVIAAQAELIERHTVHASAAMAEVNIAASLAMIAATLLTGPLTASPLTWRAALILPVAALALVQARLHRVHFSDRARPAAARPRALVMTRTLWLLAAAVLCQTGFEWTMGFWGAEYLAATTSLGDGAAASAMTLFFAGILAGRLVARSFGARVRPLVVLTASFAVGLAGFPILAVAPSVPLKLVGLALCGVGIGNAYPMIAAEAGRAARGAIEGVLGRLTAISSSSVAAAPFVVGAMGDVFGIGRAFWVLPAVLAGGVLASVALMPGGPMAGQSATAPSRSR